MTRYSAIESVAPFEPVVDADEAPFSSAVAAAEAPRVMRTDAVKNRLRILDAAEEVFAAEGVAVPIDVVAERAGLGVGTLYRHFPNKEALFEAIVIDRITQLVATAKDFELADDPGQALFSFLQDFARQAASKRDLFEALGSAGIDLKARCSELFEELMRSVDILLSRAIADGAVRGDVPANEIVSMIVGTCHAAGDSGVAAAGLGRMVTVVLDGLRPVPADS
jgi:AcrR family transcriptional regulator